MVSDRQVAEAARAFSHVAHEGGGVVGDGDELLELAMRAALEAAEAAAWEPIETAPNGNIEFDVWAAGKRIPDCHRHLGEILRWASDSVDDEPHWQRVEGVTHWRAAPSPPKDTPHG